jgi:CDP-diglyceride synthetase
MKIGFFFGLLFPVFVMVALVRVAMNDMQIVQGIWSWWTLIFTVAIAIVGTILESTLKPKPSKKIGQK